MHVFSPLNKRAGGSNTSVEAPGLLLLQAPLAANQSSNCSRSWRKLHLGQAQGGAASLRGGIQGENNAPINSRIKENYFTESRVSFGILINRESEGGKESLV